MALNPSPRKTVPLATGDELRPRDLTLPSITKRVFYCGVVVEGSEHGRRLPDEIQDLVLSLGNPLPEDDSMLSSSRQPSNSNFDSAAQRQRALTDTSALTSVITELVTSERSYVRRLQILKNDYADPLRNFARSKETAILPAYEAKTLFGNIDNLLPVNEAFLTDLEKMMAPNGPALVGGVGDVLLKHFRDQRGFEQYKQYYVKREDAQQIFEREVSKRSSRFGSYIDHIKYQSTETKNRIGLRELLMEPVQRIPRYTLLFRTMLKHMDPDDPQRAKILEADEIASKIAQAETDEQTKRAAIFYCLSATIDGFPPDLFSNSRKFIDCIDVEDVIGVSDTASVSSTNPSGSNSGTVLHCTLFLFDDKLLIVKRPNGDKGGKALSGLDGLEKLTKAGGIPTGKKKSGMSSKGVVDLADVVVSDPGGADINMFLESPPPDQSERWSGRPFRSLVVVNPPVPVNMDPMATEADKRRFLENLWQAQATYRSRAGQSVVLCSEEQEVENRANRTTYARTYYNVYTRTAFLQEPKKTKVVVHIDPMGSADPIPFGIGAAPYASIRLQLIAGGLCRFSLSSNDPEDDGEEDIVQIERVPSRIVNTIHQFGFFQFRTGRNSIPGTPTARSKASIFGLDALSRGFFHSRPASAMGDFFGGSITSHRRAKSATSRSSIYTDTTTTADSLLKSHRSNSTAATTITMDDSSSFLGSRSSKGGKSKRRRDQDNDSDVGSLGKKLTSQSLSELSKSLSRSHSVERQWQSDYSDMDDDEATIGPAIKNDTSDYNLALQLELARQNSLNQHGKPLPPINMDMPIEETIYEEEPPQPIRQASMDGINRHLTTPRPASPSKRPESPADFRPTSRQSERRPLGPRSPSPLPPTHSPSARSVSLEPMSTDEEMSDIDDEPLSDHRPAPSRSRHSTAVSGIPRSRRQPLHPTPANNVDATPRASTSNASSNSTAVPSSIEPLSIKKKVSTRSSSSFAPPTPTPTRKSLAKNSPLSRVGRTGSARKVSPQFKRLKPLVTSNPVKCDLVDSLIQTAVSTKEDIESSHRAVKRIKLEVEKLNSTSTTSSGSEEPVTRPSSPEKSLRTTPTHSQPITKEAQQRLDEMRLLINRRQDIKPPFMRAAIFDGTPKSRDRSGSLGDFSPKVINRQGSVGSVNQAFDLPVSQSLNSLTNEAEEGLVKALKSQEGLQKELHGLAGQFKEKLLELERVRLELQNAKRQTELVKSLLADATAEKEIMYEAFNEELDDLFKDVNLPDDEAWEALQKDLKQATESRNELSKENSHLKRRLAETESQCDEWAAMLRSRGLIP